MLIVELVILCVLFWGICYLNTGRDDKNIKSYASYPDEVQEMANKNPVLQSKIKTSSPFVSFVSNIVVFGTVLFIFMQITLSGQALYAAYTVSSVNFISEKHSNQLGNT